MESASTILYPGRMCLPFKWRPPYSFHLASDLPTPAIGTQNVSPHCSFESAMSVHSGASPEDLQLPRNNAEAAPLACAGPLNAKPMQVALSCYW